MELEWLAESLRVSLFTRAAAKLTDKDWQALTGQEEAETRTQIPGGRAFRGKSLGGQLMVAAPGPRIDCVLSALQPAEPREDNVISLGTWDAASVAFLLATAPWIKQLEVEVTRLAFGCVLLLKTGSREDANARLRELLGSVTVTPEMRDVIFRVNWPRYSNTLAQLLINRITTFSATQIAQATLFLSGDTASQVGTSTVSQLVRLEIDHNTDQEWSGVFEPEPADSIYRELVMLADENARKGEVR